MTLGPFLIAFAVVLLAFIVKAILWASAVHKRSVKERFAELLEPMPAELGKNPGSLPASTRRP